MKSEKALLYLIIVVSALFSFLFGFYAINPSLHYHSQQIAWQSSDLFLNYYLAFSGGPAEYLTLFITQFFYSDLMGSVIIAASGFLISFFLFKTIYLRWGKFNLMFLLVPLVQIVLLALMCDYNYHFPVTVNLIIVSGFLFLCTVIEKRAGFNISYHTLIAGALLYYISGGMYFIIFMVSSFLLLFKRLNRKMVFNAILIFAETLLIPYIAHHFVFLSSLNNSFFRSTPDVAVMLRYSRPLLFYTGLATIPVVILLTGISTIALLPKKKDRALRKNAGKSKIKKQGVLPLKINNWKIGVAVQVFVLIVTSGIILYKVYEPVEKAKVEIDFYAGHQNWEKVITMSEKMETYDRMVNFQYNRALINTGQLLEKLFDYEQLLGSQGLFLDRPFAAEVALPNSDIYFDLGNIDESQRYAFESETLMKNSPRVLKRLILNCIIMNKTEAANTYINILAANPIEKKWVKKYSGYISNPNLATFDSLIVKKRMDMSQTEGMFGTPPLKLISQLEKNPQNKAAFECLIAFDLMEHDVVSLTEDFQYINKLNYKKLPVVLEEAVILYRSQGKNNEFFNRIRVSEPTAQRFREFAKLTSAAKGDREKAKQATQAFKNTYWYYVLFISPKVTNLKLDTKPVEANY
jgi:hypothetical protein